MFNKTVDGIVRSLTKMVSELELVIESNQRIQVEAELTAAQAAEEISRARKIQNNLEGLLS